MSESAGKWSSAVPCGGRRPWAIPVNMGLLNERVLAHMVDVTDEELELVAASGRRLS